MSGQNWEPNPNDVRSNGEQKGNGFFGALKRPDGKISSELSIGVNIGGKETEIPSLVPTLSAEEVQHLLNGGQPTTEIVQKASQYAIERMKAGRPVFATPDDPIFPVPSAEKDAFDKVFK